MDLVALTALIAPTIVVPFSLMSLKKKSSLNRSSRKTHRENLVLRNISKNEVSSPRHWEHTDLTIVSILRLSSHLKKKVHASQ